MKRHSVRSANCSCTKCVYRSISKQTSINKLTQGGTRIDRLYYGKYLPLREKKLLEQIKRTRDAYDDVQSQLISVSANSGSENKLRLRKKHDTKANSVAMKMVDDVDRGRFGLSNASSCSSCCSCDSLNLIENSKEWKPMPCRHHVPSENITKYTAEAGKSSRRKKRLSSKISSKFRNVNYKIKRIQSEPLSSIVTRPSEVFIKIIQSKVTANENGKIDKDNKNKNPLRKKNNYCSCKIAKVPSNSGMKTKVTRHSATKDSLIDIGKLKPFEIRKDSLSLFREKLKKGRLSYECEPGSCIVDKCIPEKCLHKLYTRNLLETKANKYYNRRSGSGKSHVSVSRQLKKPYIRKSHDQVTATRIPGQRSISSMATLSLKKSIMGTDYVRPEPKQVRPKGPKKKPLTQSISEKKFASDHKSPKPTASTIFNNYHREKEHKPKVKSSLHIYSMTTILDTGLHSIPSSSLMNVRAPLLPITKNRDDTKTSNKTGHGNKKRMQMHPKNKTKLIFSSTGVSNSQISKLNQNSNIKQRKVGKATVLKRKTKATPAQGLAIRKVEKEKGIHATSQQKPMNNFKSRNVESFAVLSKSTSSVTKAKDRAMFVKPLRLEKEYKTLNHTIRKKPEMKSEPKCMLCKLNVFKNKQHSGIQMTKVISKVSQAPYLPITNQARSKSKGQTIAKSVQSTKNTENFLNNRKERKLEGLHIKNIGNYFNPHRRPARTISNVQFNTEFYKSKSDMESGDKVQLKYTRRMKQKSTQLEHNHRDRKMQFLHQVKHNKVSKSKSSQFKNIQVGHGLKRCLCSLKLFQKNRPKEIHVASKKTMASINAEKLKKGGHQKQTQTGNAHVTPHLTTLQAPPCEPLFCNPEECNPYDCAERHKWWNHRARRSKFTNTISSSKMSSALSTRPLPKSISRKVQSNENRLRREKGNNPNTSKIRPRALTSKSVRRAVKIGSSFAFNIEMTKRNAKKAPNKKERLFNIKLDNIAKNDSRLYQQPGIKVYKPRDYNKTLQTKADGSKNIYTKPFFKKWLYTLGLWKNNKKSLETSPSLLRKKTAHVIKLQNKPITANRAEILYNYARTKRSLDYKLEISNVNDNYKLNSPITQQNNNTVDRKALSDKPKTSSRRCNQSKRINRHFDCKTNFLNECYLPVQTGSILNMKTEFPKLQSLVNKDEKSIKMKENVIGRLHDKKQKNKVEGSRELKRVYQKEIEVLPIKLKGTHDYFVSVIKRFFTFNLKNKEQQMKYQYSIFKNNTMNRNLSQSKRISKSKVHRKHNEGVPKHNFSETKTYNPYPYNVNTEQQQKTRAPNSCLSTDSPKNKSVASNLKSKSTQSKIFKKYAGNRLRTNGRTTHVINNFSTSRPTVPLRSNININLSKNRTASAIQNKTDKNYKVSDKEPICKHKFYQKNKIKGAVINVGSLLKRLICKPGLKKKNTGSKTKNNNCQTNSNHHMKSNDLQPSWKSPQNTSNSNFNRICGQRSGNESYHATKRIQNNHYLIKSRQFQSRIDFNIGEYQIGCCLNTRQNNLFTQSLYTPNVRDSIIKSVPFKVITNPSIPLKANKCEPGGCVQYEYDINNHFQRSKLCCAKALESNLVESYNNKYKLDKRSEVYTKSQKSTHVGKSEKQYISVKSDVHTRMGVNNDVKHYRKDELQKQTFLSKCLRSLFKKEKYKNVNQPVLRKNHSDDRLRKARHFRSDLHNDATLLKQAKYDNYFSVSDKTHNSRIENIRSQVNKTHSRATGLTKLLKQCYCTANMQYEIQKQSESQKVINNLTLNSLTVKSAKKSETARKIKSVVEPKKLDRAMRSHTNKYDPKDGNHKEIFRESQSTKTHRRLNQNSQTFGITYPKYNPASILSERSRTFQPKIHYKSREWSPRSNYYVLRCEDSQRSRVKFGTNFRMGIDFSKNKHGNICPGMTTSQRNQLEAAATGDGCGATARQHLYNDTAEIGRPRKSSIKSYTDEDYTNYSVNKRGLKSKNTQYKRNKGTRSKSIIARHDTKDEGSEIVERRNETGAARPTIVLEGKESEMIEATQTDREVKTIMPYSKKKFHKLESRTKLSHHSTNTPDNVNKLKFKGIKRNERIVINKNDRNATQEIIVTHPDGTQDKDGNRGIIRKFLGMYRKPGHQKVTKKRQKDKVLNKGEVDPTPDRYSSLRTRKSQRDRDASQGDFENRLDLIWKALARRPKQQVVMEKPLFEMLVQKDNMSILNKDEILPILKSRRYNATAPRRTQGDFYIPSENIDENRLKMIRRALGLSQKPRASEKPVFDMMVQRQNMRILNKDEVLPILSTPEALRRRKAGPTSPPRMEIHVDKTTASIINSDEIISQLKKERRREMLRRHRAGLVSMSDGEALLKLHGKQCKCCFCRKYKQQRIIQKFKMKPRRLNPCICGSDICKKDWSKLKMEQSDLQKVKDIPTCVCGSKVCEEEIEKLPKRKLKAARRERVKERIKMKKKLYRQARKQRRKQYRLEDLKRLRRREDEDRRKMKKIKSLKSPPASIMAVESLKDMGAFGFRFIGDTMRSFSRIAKHPKDAMYNAHETMYAVKQDPKTVIKKVQQNYRETGLKPTVARVKQRAIQTSMGKRIKKKMESHPFTNYLVHLTDPDPKTWMKKKRRRRRHKEPVVYEGSLYMNTLRKKPFLRVYRMCPWFYPHCVSLFGLWKQLANVLMFLLAICVWSPCILCFEVCRALTCCCMCTGFDY